MTSSSLMIVKKTAMIAKNNCIKLNISDSRGILVFIITGGGSGIGRALALALAAREKKVLIVGRTEQTLNEVKSHSHLISTLPADVSSHDGRQKIIDHLHDVPSLQGLIHCAVTILPILPVRDITESDWRASMSTNVDAPLFLTQALLDKLDQGRVLHMVSNLATHAAKGLAAYCVSKAALMALTRCWQLDSVSMSFAMVNPFVVDTNMLKQLLNADDVDKSLLATVRTIKQQRRVLSPETVALFLAWLLLDVDKSLYASKEWDITDTTHHANWLPPDHTL